MRLLDLPARFTAAEMRMLQSVRGRHIAEQFLISQGIVDDPRLAGRLSFIKWMVICECIRDDDVKCCCPRHAAR